MEKIRKKRADAKVDCKPTIPTELKETIYRLSYITNTPVKDIAEKTCLSGIVSKRVIEYLSNYLRRDYQFKNTFYLGSLGNNLLMKNEKNKGASERITIRFTQHDYEGIRSLAFSLGVTPSKTVAILLDVTIKQTNFLNRFTKDHLKNNLNDSRIRELRKVIGYVNKNSPYNENISWASLLSFLYDELKTGSRTINNWIDNIK